MYRDNLMYFKKKTFDINMKQSEELKSPLYVVHVEFEKAFDNLDSTNSRLRPIPKFRWTEKIRKED